MGAHNGEKGAPCLASPKQREDRLPTSSRASMHLNIQFAHTGNADTPTLRLGGGGILCPGPHLHGIHLAITHTCRHWEGMAWGAGAPVDVDMLLVGSLRVWIWSNEAGGRSHARRTPVTHAACTWVSIVWPRSDVCLGDSKVQVPDVRQAGRSWFGRGIHGPPPHPPQGAST